MKIAFISDIHANLEAILAIADLLEEADKVICLGDLAGYYCQVNEAIDFLRKFNPLCVRGNHDHYVLNGCPESLPENVKFGIEYAARVITPENRRWLSSLPLVWGGEIDKVSLLLSHGSPWRPLDDYLYQNNPALDELKAFAFDIIAFGQTHRPLIQNLKKPYYINPGSIGQSRQAKALTSLVQLDTSTLEIILIQRPYDPTRVMELARKNGAGEWITKHLI